MGVLPGFRAWLGFLVLCIAAPAFAGSLSGSVNGGGGLVSLSAEGPSDWVHWGLTNVSSVNRKFGVTAQISGLTHLSGPSGRFGGNGSVHTRLAWNDGTPTANESGFPGGLYYAGIGSGYEFTVPAGGTSRTLKVYLGGYQARGRIEATLSDGSAAAYVATVEDLSGPYDHVVTLTFQADAPSATLTFRYTLLQGGNVTVHGAALDQAGSANLPPTLNPIGNKTATVGANLNFTVTASDPDGPAPIAMTIASSSPDLPGSASYSDNGNGSANFSWTPSAAHVGTYQVTFRARDDGGSGQFAERQVQIQVNAAGGGGGSLSGSAPAVTSPGIVSLSTQGPADWVHWGLSNISSVNRKAGVSAQISGLSHIGGGPSGRFTGNASVHNRLAWTGGTPTASESGFPGGLYYAGIGSGYEFTVPAGGTSRTLKVYLGGYQARGRIEATLSDGSASPYVATIENLSGPYDHVVTLAFQGSSPSATLTFRYTLLQGGNVTLHGAALEQAGSANLPPTLNPIGNKTATAGTNLSFSVTASDPDGPAPIAMTIANATPALPGSASYSDNGNGSANFSWTPSAAHVGTYQVTFRAREGGGSGAFTDQQIQIQVNAAGGGGGSMSGSAPAVTSPGIVSLTTQGPADWVHWGLNSVSSVNRKAGVAAQISGLSHIGGGPSGRFTGNASVHTRLSWTGGTPTASESGFPGGLYYAGVGSGYEFTVPAGGASRTLKVYLGGYQARGRIEATLSDGSASPYVTTIENLSGPYDHIVTLTFQGSSPSATLTFRYTLLQGGNVTLHGAALAGGGGGSGGGLTLPFSDNFGSGGLQNWSIIDEVPAASQWQVSSGAMRQLNRVESVFALDASYHLGTFAYRSDATSLTDYRLRATAQFLGPNLQDDIGVLFRYQNPDNYYRLSVNARYGFTRLEKRVGGVFTPLASNSRGYRPGAVVAFDIEVIGNRIFVTVDGDPLFAVTDGSLGSGSFGFYAQDATAFDNLQVTAPDTAPRIVLQTPLAYSTLLGDDIAVIAEVLNMPAGGSVRFLLDGSQIRNDATAPYQRNFANVNDGNHVVEALLLNGAGSEVARDTNPAVGTSGRPMVSVGDSLTNGIGDVFEQDNESLLGRIIASQGFQAGLTDALDASTATMPALVVNEGIGGDESFDAAFTRVASILERNDGTGTVLIGLGTNDALGAVPAGSGCNGAACSGTFRGNMQALVDRVRWANYPTNTQPSGITPVVALVPPAWNSTTPWTSTTNDRIRQYNSVIRNELTGSQLGPDLFDYFMPSASVNRRSLFADTLHPNGLGYQVMGALWHNALQPGSPRPLPFVLQGLQKLGSGQVQQNLIATGDPYYVEAAHRITAMPNALLNGRWVMTHAADAGNASSNYLTFTLDRPATVYVAFDGGASALPAWMSSFAAAGQLSTSNPASPTMTLHARSYAAGPVTLGGNAQAPSSGADATYVVIIVEQ